MNMSRRAVVAAIAALPLAPHATVAKTIRVTRPGKLTLDDKTLLEISAKPADWAAIVIDNGRRSFTLAEYMDDLSPGDGPIMLANNPALFNVPAATATKIAGLGDREILTVAESSGSWKYSCRIFTYSCTWTEKKS